MSSTAARGRDGRRSRGPLVWRRRVGWRRDSGRRAGVGPPTRCPSQLRAVASACCPGRAATPIEDGNTSCRTIRGARRWNSSISHLGGVIARMPASDLVCGWTISPTFGSRTTVPSMTTVPACRLSSIFSQSRASSSPMREPDRKDVDDVDQVVLFRGPRFVEVGA